MIVVILAVPIGGLLGWRWVRNLPLRLVHALIMGYIVVDAVLGKLCFLTLWEESLRRAAGQESLHDISFVGRMLHEILFVEVDQSILNGIYIAVGVLVLAGWLFVPPRRQDKSAAKSA